MGIPCLLGAVSCHSRKKPLRQEIIGKLLLLFLLTVPLFLIPGLGENRRLNALLDTSASLDW